MNFLVKKAGNNDKQKLDSKQKHKRKVRLPTTYGTIDVVIGVMVKKGSDGCKTTP